MRLFSKLWRDESGVLLSAEAVVVGTVAVVGLTTGLTVVAKSVNEELQDVAFAIRSLDQSYSIPAQEGCGARTAGSSFTQEPVKKSLQELCDVIDKAEKQEKSQAARLEQQMKKEKQEDGDKKKKKDRQI
jgi:Flp pilus assembly pilin Flp